MPRLIPASFIFTSFAFLALSACDIPESGFVHVPVADSIATEPVVVAEAAARTAKAAIAPPVPLPPARRAPTNPRRGVVTAGDIDDARNLAAFLRYQSRAAQQTGIPTLPVSDALAFQVMDQQGTPAPGVNYTLVNPATSRVIHAGQTGVDGRVMVFPHVLGAGQVRTAELRVYDVNQQVHTRRVSPRDGLLKLSVPVKSQAPEFLDLAFVIDTTGSMGDELAWLTREFKGIVRAVQKAAPEVDMRFAVTAYRDRGDAYEVQRGYLSHRAAQAHRSLGNLDASGGGDYPEAAAKALQQTVNINWRRGNGKRILFHIADAPPHRRDAHRFLDAAKTAAQANIQIFGLGASGVAAESELYMRQAALVTGGRYMFLTDDSGVGNAHAEPNIACYRVTALKSLLVRVLTSELTGKRHEANRADIIRTVGSYNAGVCNT